MDSTQQIEKIREQESIIKELEQDIQSKKQWISLIAHDFIGVSRNLLWVLDALQNKEITPEILSELLPELKSSAIINQHTIESTLAWVYAQHDSFVPQKDKISGFNLFQSIQQSLSNELKKKSIQLSFEGDQDATFINDEVLIRFILRKIIENAIKYSYVSGNIIFHCMIINNESIKFTIEDFGAGMSDRVLEGIFNINEVTHTGTLNEKGAGISLAIIKDIAKLINASIEVTSREDSGTKIRINLPQTF
ncbi:HAMP domain-containing sensor histidine kinase [Albibacterium sp.]|uniref:sensor histidine kinase n=1 Tax=Albibacterium sp. TaxID=2952885 RepID=UPI002CDF30D0|nr:HAMP domain-containing sensor histidine kinase [Albibacterium sp.]HUH18728.1 HAMP domain-containing sensor histidine kinase [Albibacterium sp.]